MKGKVSRLSRGILVATASSALVLGVLPGIAHAAPSVTDLQKQISDLNNDAEVNVEKFNAAKADQEKKQREADAAASKVKEFQETLDKSKARLRGMAAASYIGAPAGDLAIMLTADSPANVIEQLDLMELVAGRRNAAVAGVLKAKKDAEGQQTKASEALATAKKLADDLATQKGEIQKKIDDLEKKLNSLTAEQRASVFDPGTVLAPVTNIVAPNPNAQTAVNAAMSKRGSDYVWAAAGPNVFDCSGLTMWAWAQAGKSIPRNSQAQFDGLTHISAGQLQPGDLVFFYSPIHHVGMYIGEGLMVHAPQTGDVVKVTAVSAFGAANITGYGRVV